MPGLSYVVGTWLELGAAPPGHLQVRMGGRPPGGCCPPSGCCPTEGEVLPPQVGPCPPQVLVLRQGWESPLLTAQVGLPPPGVLAPA